MTQIVSVQATYDGVVAKVNVSQERARRALVRTLNKVAITVRAEAARKIRDVGYGLKIGDIKDNIDIRKANVQNATVIIRASGRPIPLIKYAARENAQGVSVQVLHGRKTIPHAFIATMPTGHRGVFVRKKGTELGKRGKPILQRHLAHELFGPSVPQAMAKQAVGKAMEDQARARFPTVLGQELAYEASRGT